MFIIKIENKLHYFCIGLITEVIKNLITLFIFINLPNRFLYLYFYFFN